MAKLKELEAAKATAVRPTTRAFPDYPGVSCIGDGIGCVQAATDLLVESGERSAERGVGSERTTAFWHAQAANEDYERCGALRDELAVLREHMDSKHMRGGQLVFLVKSPVIPNSEAITFIGGFFAPPFLDLSRPVHCLSLTFIYHCLSLAFM